MSIVNPHLFSCENPYYVFVDDKIGFAVKEQKEKGPEAHEKYLAECAELFDSFYSTFWIKLSDFCIEYKSDADKEFFTYQYTLLELVIIAEHLAAYKWWRLDTYEQKMFAVSSKAVTSRLNGLLPVRYAVSTLKYIEDELSFPKNDMSVE